MNDTIDFFQKPTGYSNFLDNFEETDNVIYNIINYQSPQIIFSFGLLLVIFIYTSARINFNYSILIGLIFYSILIYYIYTNIQVNYVNNYDKLNEKYELLNTNNNILKKYPNIIDFLFYMTEFKSASLTNYLKLESLFEQFILYYESCLEDIKLINTNFDNLKMIKNKILFTINFFNFNLLSNTQTLKLYEMRKNIEKLLNAFLDELYTLQDKNIYYNGFNYKTSLLNKDNVYPVNFLDYQNQYIRNTKQYDISNLFLL